jgi:hypothetical protein
MYIRPQFALFLYPVCIHEVNVNKYPINLVESLTYMIQCTGILLMCCLQNWSLIYIINTKCGLFFKVIKKYSYVNDKFLETDFLIQRSLITVFYFTDLVWVSWYGTKSKSILWLEQSENMGEMYFLSWRISVS